jgi:hypothetical protein
MTHPVPELRLTHETLTYEIQRRRRKTVGVVVRRDGRVEVVAPPRTAVTEVRRIVEEFRPWIEKKRAEAKERQRRRRLRQFDDGETIPFLGETLRLRVVPTDRPPVDGVVRDGDVLTIRVPTGLSTPSRRAVVRYAILGWLLERAREVFHERHVLAAKRVGRTAKRVVIKDMASRWGSCGPQRKMSLNWRVVLAPLPVVDYVVVHELCHIHEANHSSAFWRRVAAACEDWRESRAWLRRHGDELEL